MDKYAKNPHAEANSELPAEVNSGQLVQSLIAKFERNSNASGALGFDLEGVSTLAHAWENKHDRTVTVKSTKPAQSAKVDTRPWSTLNFVPPETKAGVWRYTRPQRELKESKLGAIQVERHCTGVVHKEEILRGKKQRKWRSPDLPSHAERKRTAKHKETVSFAERYGRNKHREEKRRPRARLFGIDYESWFSVGVNVGEKTMNSFEGIVGSILSTIKDCFNNSQNAIRCVVELDATRTLSMVFAIGCAVAAIYFAKQAYDTNDLFNKVLAGLTASGAIIAGCCTLSESMRKYLMETFLEKECNVENPDAGKTGEQLEAELAAAEAEGAQLGAQEIEKNAKAGCSHAPEIDSDVPSHKLVISAEYQSVFDDGVNFLSRFGFQIASSILAVVAMVKLTGDDAGYVKRISEAPRVMDGLTSLLHIVLQMFSSALDFIFGTSFTTLMKGDQAIDDWAARVSAVLTKSESGVLLLNTDSAQLVAKLRREGRELVADKKKMTMHENFIVRSYMQALETLALRYDASALTPSERQVPLVLCFRGESGVGKSMLTRAFINSFGARIIPEDEIARFAQNPMSEAWVWKSEEEFANGYKNQRICIMDDFMQFKNQPGQKGDMLSLIRLANYMAAPLNAAALHDKGKVFFTSDVIICSTNLYKFYPTEVVSIEAGLRRVDVWIDMYPRVEYCSEKTKDLPLKERRLDESKFPEASGLFTNACEFHLKRYTDFKQQTEELVKVMDYDEMLDHCEELYKSKKKSHLAKLSDFAELRQAELKKRGIDIKVERDYESAWSWVNTQTTKMCNVANTAAKKTWDWFAVTTPDRLSIVDRIKTTYITYKEATKEWFKGIKTEHWGSIVVGLFSLAVMLVGMLVGHFAGKAASAYYQNSPERAVDLGDTYINSLLSRNVRLCYKKGQNPEDQQCFGKIILLRDTIAMLNAHTALQIQEGLRAGTLDPAAYFEMYAFGKRNSKVSVPLKVFVADSVIIDKNKDVCILDLGKTCPAARDITHLFVDEATLRKNRDFNVTLVDPRSLRHLHSIALQSKVINKDLLIKGNLHNGLVTYRCDSVFGTCGSLLICDAMGPERTKRILGLHMAAVQGEGVQDCWATTTTSEYLTQALNKFPSAKIEINNVEIVEPAKFVDTSLEVVMQSDLTNFQSPKSKITKSLMYEVFGPAFKAPAKLAPFVNSDGVEIKPLTKAILDKDAVCVPIDDWKVTACVEAITRKLAPFVEHHKLPLSFEDGVLGFGELGAVPRNTSMGVFGLRHPHAGPGKTAMFGSDQDYTLDTNLSRACEALCDAKMLQASNGIIPEVIYMPILKDETRPLAKVEAGKTRLIAACSVEDTVMYRRLFGWVCSELVRSRLHNGIAVGMNPFSEDWELLAKMLQSRGKKVVAGDFSGFDNSQSHQLINAVVDIMIALSGEQDPEVLRAMRTLAPTLSQAKLLLQNLVIQNNHGLPSGNPMTSIMNSLFGHIVFRLVWLEMRGATPATCAALLDEFETEVYLVMYGDDNVLNVSDRISGYFNQHTLMAKFPSVGMTYTSDVKEDLTPPIYRSLEEVTFLKRSFRFEPQVGRHVAPLEYLTVMQMCYYTKEGNEANAITLDNVKTAIMELTLHGQDVYERDAKLLCAAAKDRLGATIAQGSWYLALLAATQFKPIWVSEHV